MNEESKIWREYAYYVECPYCKETNELGDGCIPNDKEEMICEFCNKEFISTWEE